MSEVAIRVENLGKAYRITRTQGRSSYRTLQEEIIGLVRRPFQRGGNVSNQETVWALKDVSIEIKHGEVIGIIGRNGAGKSTLLKILSRITEPTTGFADIYGRVGSLLEVGTGFHPELTGRENIYLNGTILGMRRWEIDRKFDEIVDFAEVERYLDTPVKHYSSGMYVRLAFAVAAHLEPEILVVDEVLAVGDASFQKKCLGKMGAVAKEGRTVLFVSHNMAAIESLCSKGVLLEKGMVTSTGGLRLVVEDYLESVTRSQDAVPLAERKDRAGGDRLRIISYRIGSLDSQEELPLACGGDGKIELEFHSNEARLDRLRFGIAFRDKLTGQALIEFNSYYATDENLSCGVGTGRIVFEIKKFPLTAGEYMISLIATSDLEVLDWVREVGTETIHEGNYYATGRMPINNGVIFHHDYSCYLDRSQL